MTYRRMSRFNRYPYTKPIPDLTHEATAECHIDTSSEKIPLPNVPIEADKKSIHSFHVDDVILIVLILILLQEKTADETLIFALIYLYIQRI